MLSVLTLVALSPLSVSSVTWYQTAQSTNDRLSLQPDLVFSPKGFPSSEVKTTVPISIDLSSTAQPILGFGGALTQSSAAVYQQLSPATQEELITSYYSTSGLNYGTGRMPIHSCDFSPESYTFDETSGDSTLSSFDDTVLYDQNLSLPLIHDALAANPKLLLFGSPWSPPAWMKDTGDMQGGGKLLPEYRDSWAQYFSKWITAYEKQNVPVWAVTVQNEPENAASWESCEFTAEETRDFVADHLGPVLERDHPDTLIFGFDHNKDHVADWADVLVGDGSPSQSMVDGIAFHWYSGACFDNVASVSAAYPDKILLPSEACFELAVLQDDDQTEDGWLVNGTWAKGEGYGFDIMGDLNAGSAGWTDWNILLDENGGPNHVGNFCDAAVIADTQNDKLHYHPQYWYLGHFSKFLLPGMVKVGVDVANKGDGSFDGCSWPYGTCDGSTLQSTAFKDEDGRVVVVVMNCGDDEKELQLNVKGVDAVLENAVPAHSIQTYLL